MNNYLNSKDNLRMCWSHIYTTFLKIKEDKDGYIKGMSGFPLITPLRLHVARDLRMRCFLFKTLDGMFFPWKAVSKVESDEQRHVSAYSADSPSVLTTKKNGLVAKQTESQTFNGN